MHDYKSDWTTYKITGHVSRGLNFHQVRKHGDEWQHRVLRRRGSEQSIGAIASISPTQGEAAWKSAMRRFL